MCCSCCTSCVSFIASIFTILQCIVQMIFCSWMINLYQCKTTKHLTTKYRRLLYLTYFYKKECSNQHLISHLEASFELPQTTSHTESTYMNVVTVTLFDLVWILTSIVLLASSFTNSKNYKSYFVIPWLICCLSVCSLDVALLYKYARHIEETDTLDKWLFFVGATNINDNFDELVKGDWTIYERPSIFMTLFFGRGVVIWFINVVLFIFLLVATCQICSKIRGNSQQQNQQRQQ